MAQITVILTSGTSWVVPADCNKIDRVDCIGGGGSGGLNYGFVGNATGGGGGGFSRAVNIFVTPTSSVSYQIGAGGAARSSGAPGGLFTGNAGTDTWFINTSTCLAKGGGGGPTVNTPTNGGAGGAAVSGVGSLKFNGGSGGTATASGVNTATGGGGAGGFNGNGIDGGSSGASTQTAGGAGDAGSGGASNGGSGTEYGSVGSGGGGNALFQNGPGTATSGGLYGAGGGGRSAVVASGVSASGAGRSGLIVIVYTQSVAGGFNMPMLGM